MEPRTVSVVDPETMEVVADIPTGIMPHGSRITDNGKFQYHVSMMTDELVEINTSRMKVSRRLNIAESSQNHSHATVDDSKAKQSDNPRTPLAKPT